MGREPALPTAAQGFYPCPGDGQPLMEGPRGTWVWTLRWARDGQAPAECACREQDEVSVPQGPGTLPHFTTWLTGRGRFSGFPMNADPAPYLPCLLHLDIWVRPSWTQVYLS